MSKLEEALNVVKNCSKDGFYASSDVYKYEYWTRDLSFFLPVLIKYGYKKEVENQILNIFKKQKSGGELPVFYVKEKFLWLKSLFSTGRIKPRKNHLFGIGFIFSSIFDTVDSTISGIISFYDYVKETNSITLKRKYDENIRKAYAYIEKRIDDNFLVGNDWKDLMLELRNKKLIANQCLLYRAYLLSGMKEKAEKLKKYINTIFWNGEYYNSTTDSRDIDVFGNSLAVLFGIADEYEYNSIKGTILSASSQYGIRNIIFKHKINIEKLRVDSCDQYGTIWPFVSYSAISALIKMGYREEAEKEFNKLERLKGFNEFYSLEGFPKGSKEQLWSACAYISAYEALKN